MTFTFETAAGTEIGSRTFHAEAGYAYTLALTGPLEGPVGQVLFNESPFVFIDDLTLPNPGRFKGRWYRLSETDLVIDLRIFEGDVDSPTQAEDYARLREKDAKIGISYPEIPFGTYSFQPAAMDTTDILLNANYDPPQVGQFGVTFNSRQIYDVWACGNSLLAADKPNTLRIFGRRYTPKMEDGCVLVDAVTKANAEDFSDPDEEDPDEEDPASTVSFSCLSLLALFLLPLFQ